MEPVHLECTGERVLLYSTGNELPTQDKKQHNMITLGQSISGNQPLGKHSKGHREEDKKSEEFYKTI